MLELQFSHLFFEPFALMSKLYNRKKKIASHKVAIATYGLVGLNLLVFAFEMAQGGSEDLDTLYQLGALSPQEVWNGQWWRLFNANFLHFGWLHLVTNMVGLYFLGKLVEFALGIYRYLLIYLTSGVGSMFTFSLLANWSGDTSQILVGASAAIMGLVGAVSAIFFDGWRRERTRQSAQRLRFIFLVIIFQSILDLMIPRVSFLSHLFGLIIGFVTGVFVIP